MKDVIHINEPVGARFDLALDQLVERGGFEYQDVWFRKEDAVLNCAAVSPTSAESLTEAAASVLIEHARSLFNRRRVSSSRFNSLTHSSSPKPKVTSSNLVGRITLVLSS